MQTQTVQSEASPAYIVNQDLVSDDDIIGRALYILESRMKSGPVISSPAAARAFLTLKLGGLEHEVFAVVFLDSQHNVIAYEEMFRGTLSESCVYPREVIKRVLALNAGAVILAHNHPSGVLTPSRADELLTTTLKTSLHLVDCRVVDHIVVGPTGHLSFAEKGLL